MESRLRIAGQAVQPILVAFPLGLFVMAVIFDVADLSGAPSILGSLTIHSDPSSPIYDKKSFAYDASKTALNAFTVHLAHALKDTPIKVNSAHPGWAKTDMGGSAATLSVEDGAKTIVELATLPDDGPTGGYFHGSEMIPW